MVRKVSDSNQLITQADQKNASIENGFSEILHQNDELARYYVSQRFYQNDDTNYKGDNDDLDRYLKGLMSSAFQGQVRLDTVSGSPNLEQLTDIMFTYFTVRRINSASASSSELMSYRERLNMMDTADTELIIANVVMQAASINASDPQYNEIRNVVTNDSEIVNISFDVTYDTSFSSNLKEITTRIKYSLAPYSYSLNGSDIVEPGVNELKRDVLKTKQYIVETIPKP